MLFLPRNLISRNGQENNFTYPLMIRTSLSGKFLLSLLHSLSLAWLYESIRLKRSFLPFRSFYFSGLSSFISIFLALGLTSTMGVGIRFSGLYQLLLPWQLRGS